MDYCVCTKYTCACNETARELHDLSSSRYPWDVNTMFPTHSFLNSYDLFYDNLYYAKQFNNVYAI